MTVTVQVLNGATGEVRELIAKVPAKTEQEAVDMLFSRARRDDYYYRFLGHSRMLSPSSQAREVTYNNMIYWAKEDSNANA